MSQDHNREHNEQVFEFFEKCRQTNPEQYRQLADKYPILTHRKWRTIREREQTVGLHPCPMIYDHHRYDEGDD